MEWYGFLKNTGFDDIERAHNETIRTDHLKFDGEAVAAYTAADERAAYFSWARAMLENGTFKTVRDRLIWEYHAEGLSRRQIAPRVDLEHSYITVKIKKISTYLKEQWPTRKEEPIPYLIAKP